MAAESFGSESEPGVPIYSEFADDAEMMELVAMFVGELPDRIAAMAAAAERDDLAGVAHFAHQIKGAAGGYGFPQITEAATALETCARAADPAATRDALDALATLCQRARG